MSYQQLVQEAAVVGAGEAPREYLLQLGLRVDDEAAVLGVPRDRAAGPFCDEPEDQSGSGILRIQVDKKNGLLPAGFNRPMLHGQSKKLF